MTQVNLMNALVRSLPVGSRVYNAPARQAGVVVEFRSRETAVRYDDSDTVWLTPTDWLTPMDGG